jgi:hypothetical protein
MRVIPIPEPVAHHKPASVAKRLVLPGRPWQQTVHKAEKRAE